jgi:hypothetical protein
LEHLAFHHQRELKHPVFHVRKQHGPDNTLVFSGNLSQLGDTLSIPLSTPFTYNPPIGDLLMDVIVSGAPHPVGTVTSIPGHLLHAHGYSGGSFNGNTFLGCAYNGCFPTASVNNGYGVVTEFGTAVSSVPELSFVYLLGAGLVALGVEPKVRLHQRVNAK